MSKLPRSLKVNTNHLETVKLAFRKTGFTQALLSDNLGISRSTLSRFFNARAIERINFIEISEMLGLDWQKISDIEEFDSESEESSNITEIEELLSQKYQLVLRSKDEQITWLEQQLQDKAKENERLLNKIIKQETGSVYIHGSTVGTLNLNLDNRKRDENYINIHESQDLTRAAKDIKTLLQQLEKDYQFNTIYDKMNIATKAIEYIEQDANLNKRVLNSLKAGGASTLESLLDHPAARIVMAALEDWQQTKK